MSEHIEFEEEEFNTRFSGQTIRRLASLLRPYALWVIGFLSMVMMVSGLDSYFTYLSKRMVDEGISAGNWGMLLQIVEQYAALILIQAVAVFGFIWLAGILGERIRYDLRQTLFNHLQELSLTYYNRTPVGWI
ncbi:MAG TPA: ABC transporter ATP-binding protein, partial [Chloroflexi bacterium]|nr:ABC transporter ATP-binding protein [Chloroflexota bacterium]